MEKIEQLKDLIKEQLDKTADADLLDLVYQLLTAESRA